MIQTAVVILNFNGEKLLQQFLPSVIQHSGDAAIIVADNGSTDKSIEVLKTLFPQVRVIALEKNYGFCEGYNRALRQVEAFYYVLLNSDVEVTPEWLVPLEKILQQDETVAALQPKILSFHQRDYFEYAGAGGGFIDSLGYPFCRGRLLKDMEADKGQYDDVRPVFWATGACLMIRSSIYQTFNGLDEDLFAHMEEIDLCWRIQRTDYKIFYCGLSRVYHVGAGTLAYDNPQKVFLNFRNGLILLFKHLGGWELLYKMPTRIMLDWIACIVFLFQGKSRNAMAVVKAHAAFTRNLRRLVHKRRSIQKHYPWYSRKQIYRGLILVAYYLGGKRSLGINNPR